MAMGKHKRHRQASLCVETARLAKGPAHPFYRWLNQILGQHGFDEYVERACQGFYVDNTWVLQVLAKGGGLLRGETLGVDATTLEANAALRSIVRRDTGESYKVFLARLDQASGIQTPTRAELARLDRERSKKAPMTTGSIRRTRTAESSR